MIHALPAFARHTHKVPQSPLDLPSRLPAPLAWREGLNYNAFRAAPLHYRSRAQSQEVRR